MKSTFRQNSWSFASAKLRAISRRLMAIIALAAVIGFSFAACSDDGGGDSPGGNTPGGNNPGGNGSTVLDGTWTNTDYSGVVQEVSLTGSNWTLKGRISSNLG
jgi:hypothetical protein